MQEESCKENFLMKHNCPLCKKSWDRCKCDLEKDFGLKIGNKEIAQWERSLVNVEQSVEQAKLTIELNEYLIPYIKKRIKEETEKLKTPTNRKIFKLLFFICFVKICGT